MPKAKVEIMPDEEMARECAKLDPSFEQQLADAGLGRDLDEWPEY